MSRHRALLAASQMSGGGNELTFPIYLTIGDNGQLGKDVHSYIVSKFHKIGMAYYEPTEAIYINGIIVYIAESNAPLEFVHNAVVNLLNTQGRYYYLSPTGVVNE